MIKDDLDDFIDADGDDTITQLLQEITRLEAQNQRLWESRAEERLLAEHWRELTKHMQRRIDDLEEAYETPTPELEPNAFINTSEYSKTREPKK